MNATPYLIGIAGPSCAGKSHLADHLARALGDAITLSLDWYYPDLDRLPLEQRAQRNFDDPSSLDSGLLIRHVRDLSMGRTIARPVYDFATHTRTGQCVHVTPAPFVLVEGIYALYWPALRDLLATRVYVDLGDELCLARRIRRDVSERGRTEQSVRDQWELTVVPMAKRYLLPTAKFADVHLLGTDHVDAQVAEVLRHVRRG